MTDYRPLIGALNRDAEYVIHTRMEDQPDGRTLVEGIKWNGTPHEFTLPTDVVQRLLARAVQDPELSL